VTVSTVMGPASRDDGGPSFDANRRAPHGASPSQAPEPLPHELAACAPPCGLVNGGTTVTPTKQAHFGLGPPEWEARDQALKTWRENRAFVHAEKARAAHERHERTREVWHDQRASSLTESFASRRDGCGQRRHVRAWCSKCGEVHVFPVGCGLGAWCEVCAHRRQKRTRRKLLEGIARAEREARRAWSRGTRRSGTEPRASLLTLTIRDTGDAVADRETITRGWVRLRAYLSKLGLRKLPFVLAWEVTDGGGCVPHVHAHASVVWPWVHLGELARAWVRATDGAAELQGLDLKPSSPAQSASYAAKYATKGCDPGSVSRETWVAWVRASATRRSYTTSRGLTSQLNDPNRPPCCAQTAGEWGGAQVQRGPMPESGVSVLATGPPVSRETLEQP